MLDKLITYQDILREMLILHHLENALTRSFFLPIGLLVDLRLDIFNRPRLLTFFILYNNGQSEVDVVFHQIANFAVSSSLSVLPIYNFQ